MKKNLFFLSLVLASVIGCRAQSVCTTAAPCTTVPTAPPIGNSMQWNPSSTVGVSYAVYRSPSSAFTFVRIDSGNVTATNYIDSSAQSGLQYDYFVEAYNSTGFSAPTNLYTVTTPLAVSAPTNLVQ